MFNSALTWGAMFALGTLLALMGVVVSPMAAIATLAAGSSAAAVYVSRNDPSVTGTDDGEKGGGQTVSRPPIEPVLDPMSFDPWS